MLTKTSKFRVDTPNPWINKGEIVESTTLINCNDYPHIFTPLFECRGKLIAMGDLVYRIINKNFKDTVKAVKLNDTHIKNGLLFFLTPEEAEEEFKKQEKKLHKKFENQEVYSNLENIWLFSNTEKLEEKPMVDIKKNLDYIRLSSKEALEILKSK
jgi:hypothetical protein